MAHFGCRSRTTPRGLARVELIVILAAIIVLVAIVVIGLRNALRDARQYYDAAQLQGIHQSFLVFSREFDGWLPRPGLINRIGNVPGRGEMDPLHEHTAALYSSVIAANYFGPELLISPAEPTNYVRAMGTNGSEYNWDLYDPANDVFWDSSFVMNVDDPTIGANASYAHLTLTTPAATTQWRDSSNPAAMILGTRGIKNGGGPGDPNHDRSPTARFFAPRNVWVGHVAFGDGSVLLINAGDNPAQVKTIFNRSDKWLSISTSVVETADGFDVVDVYDPLDN